MAHYSVVPVNYVMRLMDMQIRGGASAENYNASVRYHVLKVAMKDAIKNRTLEVSDSPG